jgi:hypothetical protein
MPPINFRPIQLRHFTEDGIAELQQMWQELVTQVNISQGVHGPIPVYNHLDLQGNRVVNAGAAKNPTDLLTKTAADPMYSTATQRAAMEAVGAEMLQTTRRLNDGTQQHRISSDLNAQGSVPPSNITGTLAWTTVAGTSLTATWTSIIVQYADLSYIGVPDGTLLVTGLANAQYDFFPYYDTALGILSFVADAAYTGAPPIAVPSGSASLTTAAGQQQNADGRVALTATASGMQVTINGGSGSATLRARA